jgi:outer membrane protein assembly factor BamB
MAVCYNLTDGTRIWMTELPGQIIAAPAQLSGRAIFCDVTGSVVSIDVESGKIEDRYSVGSRVTAPPVVYGSHIYLSSATGIVTKLTPDLKEAFRTDLSQMLEVSPLIHPTGVIQLATYGDVYTLNSETGKITGQSKVMIQDKAIQPCARENLVNYISKRTLMRIKDGTPINIDLPWDPTCQVALQVGKMAIGTRQGLIMIDGDKILWKTPLDSEASSICANNEVIIIGTVSGEIAGFDYKGNRLWNVLVSGKVAHPLAIVEGGLLVSSGNSINHYQFWDLNPKPSFIDLGFIPTGEVAEGLFSMTNPANSPGEAFVASVSENEYLSVSPSTASIAPGQTLTFTVRLDSASFKEGRYQGTITVRTASAVYKVIVAFTIVPQPFIARLALGDATMKMSRGAEKWDVKLDVAPYLKNNRTMVPLRAISESFGPKVAYLKGGCQGSDRVDITLGPIIINHCIGTAVMTKRNAGKIEPTPTFDTTSEIRGGRTFVPIRFIAEAFKATVNWDSSTKTVTITYSP